MHSFMFRFPGVKFRKKKYFFFTFELRFFTFDVTQQLIWAAR